MEKISADKISQGYTLIEDAESLAALTQTLKGVARAAVDTEADSLHHYFEKVCLIQLSVSGGNYIIDPLRDFSLSEFLEALSQKVLIFHGADYDLRILKKTFGFRPQAPVFDTMIAAQVLGYEKRNLAALVERFFGISLSKSDQKADWSKRPLSERMLTYASNDTKYLELMADALSENLQSLNRLGWHQECCERVVKTSGLPDKNDEKEAWRVKGSSKLSSEELLFVRELWKWRDEEARKRDRPPFYILQNEDLVHLAQWRVSNRLFPLHEGPSFLKRFTGENLARLENAIRAAENTPRTGWPLPPKKMDWAHDRPDPKKLDALMAACKKLAEGLGIESSFLASRSTLTSVIQHQPKSLEKMMAVSGMMKWQAELIAPAFFE